MLKKARATDLGAIFTSIRNAGWAALIEARSLLTEMLETFETGDYLTALNTLTILNGKLMFAQSRLKLCVRKTQKQTMSQKEEL
jgi:hypothetical protein